MKTSIFPLLFWISTALASNPLCRDVFEVSTATRQAHRSIATDLFHGRVIEAKLFNANQNRQQTWKVKLFNDRTQRSRWVLFKPRPFGDADGWNRAPMEYVAYEVNLLLGMDAVPPVAYRYHLRVFEQLFDEGSVQYFLPDAHRLADVEPKNWGVEAELFISDTRVLDVLLQNPDRHQDNFVRGRHWVDGVYRPALIDHGANLRHDTHLKMDTPGPFGLGEVKVFRPRTVERLKSLSARDFEHLKMFLTDEEVQGILRRRNQILEYIESAKK